MSSLVQFSLGKAAKISGTIQTVGILGCGSVGQVITRIVAQSGMDVIFLDVSDERIAEIMQEIDQQLDDVISHWGITPSEKKVILSHIKGTTNIEDLSHCDLVIETISSRQKGTLLALRQELFQNVEKVIREDAIISSDLSTLIISDLAVGLKHPERAIGIHFIEPIDQTNIVEVVKGRETSDEIFEKVSRFVKAINKKAILINESPGNISTRILIPLINEACEILMEGVASVTDIDETMRETTGYTMGPFEIADKIGLDKILKYMDNLYQEYGDKKYKASPVIKRLVRSNYLGVQTKKGFYRYNNDGSTSGNTVSCAIIK
ncbi:MAG: 3-hydroxyacyl-CoA dehydrogenase family protein [Bacteroidales bacterium]|nr:3-hydroxyacyl-CoA dehydrogenase family protein [Bacteroidales bacterium]